LHTLSIRHKMCSAAKRLTPCVEACPIGKTSAIH
jgi:hypothetical protein